MSEPLSPADPTARVDERDAWLQEALRHAPDSALAPPALLRDSILSQARAAVAVAAPAPAAAAAPARRPVQRKSALATFWSWLALPPVAAGFASIMAATLVGLMWWDRPMDETMPQSPSLSLPPLSSSSLPASASPSISQGPAAAATAPTAESFATQQTPAPPSARSPPAAPPAAVARRLGPPPAVDARAQAEAAAGDAARNRAEPFPAEAKEERSAARSSARDAMQKDDRPATPAPAPAFADNSAGSSDKERTAQARARQAAGAAAPVGRLDAAREAGAPSVTDQAAPGGDMQSASRRRESAMPAKLARSAAVARPLASLLSAAAANPSRVTRLHGDGRIAAADDALLRWLGELDAATTGLWQALDAPEGRAGVALDLHVDGQPSAAISIDTSTVTLSSRTGAAPLLWRADIGVAAAERLRNGLPR